MTTYLEYQLDDGTTILIATEETSEGKLRHTSQSGKAVIIRAEKTFAEALNGIKSSAGTLRRKLEDLRADEVEVTFGLKATGELGNFAVGKVGVEANYVVKLKWKNQVENEIDNETD